MGGAPASTPRRRAHRARHQSVARSVSPPATGRQSEDAGVGATTFFSALGEPGAELYDLGRCLAAKTAAWVRRSSPSLPSMPET
jgi:hypothetical protein